MIIYFYHIYIIHEKTAFVNTQTKKTEDLSLGGPLCFRPVLRRQRDPGDRHGLLVPADQTAAVFIRRAVDAPEIKQKKFLTGNKNYGMFR